MTYSVGGVAVAGFVVAAIVILGILGNSLILVVISRTQRLKGKGHALIANLALADTLQSANLFFMFVAIAYGGKWVFGDAVCQIHAFLTVEFVLVSMLTLCAISLNRYFMIVRPNLYQSIFKRSRMRIIIALIWILPLAFAIPPMFGWSRFEFQEGKSLCLFKFSFSVSYAILLVTTITTTPLLIILYCYYQIFIIVGAHSNRMEERMRNGPGTTASIEEIRITRTLAVVIASYCVCFLPATVINFIEMVDPDLHIPSWLDLSSMILVMANHANNPLIYGLLNRQYRNAFKAIVCFQCSSKNLSAYSSSYNASQAQSCTTNSPAANGKRHSTEITTPQPV